jgi:hypothetical protein
LDVVIGAVDGGGACRREECRQFGKARQEIMEMIGGPHYAACGAKSVDAGKSICDQRTWHLNGDRAPEDASPQVTPSTPGSSAKRK